MLAKGTIREALQKLREIFTSGGMENPSLEARLLVSMATGARMEDLIIAENDNLSSAQIDKVNEYASRRQRGEPLARIAGEKEFWGLPFFLSPATLEPRADTETLVETVLKYADKNKKLKLLDLGTGTGCIPIALLHELPNAEATAVDISGEALATAQRNAERNNVCDRFATVKSNWFENVVGTFDIITSNPPYIESGIIESLQVEVRNHDPILALDGGETGFDAYKIILNDAKKYLTPHGRIFLELGQGQLNGIMGIVETTGATLITTHRDLAGVERVAEITYGDK
ncbi:MAG: peptide chain release factor N(5)-glutamine methyltransferase [Alphaproteobacteria bacterium]|nr:peptide chain release factor N(5)-glutamine methyltransferase [Alphaproteobacteria bacterium]